MAPQEVRSKGLRRRERKNLCMCNPRRGMVYVVLTLALFGCRSTTSPDAIEYFEVVQAEWKFAQDFLAPVVGEKVYNIGWDMFSWKAYNGSFSCGEWPSVNGCVDGNTIYWNILTPGVIRHEAAHAILRKLGHPCYHWVSLDGDHLTLHCYYKPDDKMEFCKLWIIHNWGNSG